MATPESDHARILASGDGIATVRAALGLNELSALMTRGVKALLGMLLPEAYADRLADAVRLDWLAHSIVTTATLVGGLLVVFLVLERLSVARPTAFRSRVFLQDALYAFFYQGGFYVILIWSAFANAFDTHLAFLKIEILAGLPGPVHWVLYVLMVDFSTYWWHRMLHTWTPLWAFHSVHHSQEEMSFITSYRAHPFEQLAQSLFMVVPLLLIGTPTWRWLPLFLVMSMLEAAQHSALDWTYGPAYTVVVSPRFHALHHSRDSRFHHGNYAKVLSLWDFLFGTAIRAERPGRFGVEGIPPPQTLWDQLMSPFRLLREWDRARIERL